MAQLQKNREKSRQDLRVRKTLAAIEAAFRELVMKSDPGQISVAALCRRALINKKTFYLHYASITDLFREQLEKMTGGFLASVKDCALPEQLFELNRRFFLFSAAQGAFYDRLVCSDAYLRTGAALLEGFVRRVWGKSPWFASLDTAMQDMVVALLLTAGHAFYRQWVLNGRIMPMEDAIRASGVFLCGGMEGILREQSGRRAAPIRPA